MVSQFHDVVRTWRDMTSHAYSALPGVRVEEHRAPNRLPSLRWPFREPAGIRGYCPLLVPGFDPRLTV
jgi:hypothetical protein